MMSRLQLVLALSAFALGGQPRPVLTKADFRNFRFAFPAARASSISVPEGVTWMDTNVKNTITLVNGRFDFDRHDPSRGPSMTLSQVHYGYLTMRGQLDAVVVLDYHTGGSAQWSYVYAYSLAPVTPKLLGWLQTGDRASSGLRSVTVTNGGFTLDVFDPRERQSDCCSAGFVRSSYAWRMGKFVPLGPPLYGRVEEPAPR